MIVWINGGFGSGKTTLAAELKGRRPDAVVFDPEHVGFLLREVVPVPTGDFQDLRSWRELVAASVLSLHRHHADLLIVPMTLIQASYFDEIMTAIRQRTDGFLHVFLTLSQAETRRRLHARAASDDDPDYGTAELNFGLGRIAACQEAASRQSRETLMLRSDQLSPSQLADSVLARV